MMLGVIADNGIKLFYKRYGMLLLAKTSFVVQPGFSIEECRQMLHPYQCSPGMHLFPMYQ